MTPERAGILAQRRDETLVNGGTDVVGKELRKRFVNFKGYSRCLDRTANLQGLPTRRQIGTTNLIATSDPYKGGRLSSRWPSSL
jgi:hypothetical protein